MPLTRDIFRGPWAGLPVAWTSDDRFDESVYRADVARCCRAGVPGVYTGGTTGEFYAMELDEFREVARATIEECHSHDTPAMIGCSATYTLGAIRRALIAVELGADAIQVALPFWLEVADRDIAAFFKAVADSADGLPLSIYETTRCKRTLTLDQHRAIKDAVPSYGMVKANADTIGATPDGCTKLSELVNVFVGESRWVELGPYGACGGCSSLVYWNPPLILDLWSKVDKGDWEAVGEIHEKVTRLFEFLFEQFKSRGLTDTAFDRLGGVACGFLKTSLRSRGPYPSVTNEDVEILRTWCGAHFPQIICSIANPPRLRAAAVQFGITPEPSAATDNRTGARVEEVFGPLSTTMTLLDDGATRFCLVTTHFGPTTPVNVSELFRHSVAQELDLPKSHVLFLSSHNHSCVPLASNGVRMYDTYGQDIPPAQLLPVGKQLLAALQSHARQLPGLLEPVTLWWAEGHEEQITYNRKGRRADGTTYFMREQDRLLLGEDFNGDIDTQAPVVVFKNEAGRAIAALTQFTGHPVTSYHPEKPVVFGDWPQVACDVLAGHLESQSVVPVGFMQGCAGDVNSKEMFFGGVDRATEFGQMLGQSYIDALDKLKPSKRDGIDFAVETVNVPLETLPAHKVLIAELAEMDDFIQRAKSGDENTRSCAGQNFPKALSPAYRAELVEMIRSWNVWAIGLYEEGRADSVLKHLKMEIAVIRIGDVGIVALPCEPFQGIGRQIRDRSPLPISIPCGYMNVSHGYVTDGANTGDQEYMSAFYRYTKFRPPFEKPAGDVLADQAVRILSQFAKEPAHRK